MSEGSAPRTRSTVSKTGASRSHAGSSLSSRKRASSSIGSSLGPSPPSKLTIWPSASGSTSMSEKNGGVETEAADRLQRRFGGERRGVTEVDERRSFGADFAIFRQIAPGLAHQPDRRRLLSAAGEGGQEFVVRRRSGEGGGGHGRKIPGEVEPTNRRFIAEPEARASRIDPKTCVICDSSVMARGWQSRPRRGFHRGDANVILSNLRRRVGELYLLRENSLQTKTGKRLKIVPIMAQRAQTIDRTKKLPARFYVSSTGRNPVREWVLELPEADRHTVGKDIQKVEFGWPLGAALRATWGRSVGGAQHPR